MSNCFIGQMPTVKTFGVGWENTLALKPHTPSLQAISVLKNLSQEVRLSVVHSRAMGADKAAATVLFATEEKPLRAILKYQAV